MKTRINQLILPESWVAPQRGEEVTPDSIIESLERVQRNFDALRVSFRQAVDAPLVTTLPSAPYDGQVVDYRTAPENQAGVVWRLRYNAKSPLANKWETIDPAALFSGESGDVTTSSTTAVACGPTLTVPRTGEYEASMSCYIIPTGASTTVGYVVAGVAINTVGGATAVSTLLINGGGWVGRQLHQTVQLTAGDVLRGQVNCPNAQSCRFVNLGFGIRPVRLA